MATEESIVNMHIKRISEMYEEAKDCLNNLPIPMGHPEEKNFLRVFDILKELRDAACSNINYKSLIK